MPLINADCTYCPENYDPHKTPNDDTFMIGLYVVITVIVSTVIAFFVYYRLKYNPTTFYRIKNRRRFDSSAKQQV